MGSVSALFAGAYTTTLFEMVDIVKGGGNPRPTLTSLGYFFHHDLMDARQWPLPLCVLCASDPLLPRLETAERTGNFLSLVLLGRGCKGRGDSSRGGRYSRVQVGRHATPTHTSWTENTLMTEFMQESGHCQSMYPLICDKHRVHIAVEMQCICPLSWRIHSNFVCDGN
jgi:hypothetical protein